MFSNLISLLQTSALTFLVFRLSKAVLFRLIKNNVFLTTIKISTNFFDFIACRPNDSINFFLAVFYKSSYQNIRYNEVLYSLLSRELPRELPCKDLVIDRKSTRLNSSHVRISYAVFC